MKFRTPSQEFTGRPVNSGPPLLDGGGGGATEGQGVEAELAVVPGTHPSGVEADDDAVARHELDERAERLVVGAGVALEDVDADLPHQVGVVEDGAGALEGDAAELVVGVAGLDEERHPRVAAEVDDLLRLRLGLEPDVAVEPRVPHAHQVREPEAPSVATVAERCSARKALASAGVIVTWARWLAIAASPRTRGWR